VLHPGLFLCKSLFRRGSAAVDWSPVEDNGGIDCSRDWKAI
jgi:hypothetical protein